MEHSIEVQAYRKGWPTHLNSDSCCPNYRDYAQLGGMEYGDAKEDRDISTITGAGGSVVWDSLSPLEAQLSKEQPESSPLNVQLPSAFISPREIFDLPKKGLAHHCPLHKGLYQKLLEFRNIYQPRFLESHLSIFRSDI